MNTVFSHWQVGRAARTKRPKQIRVPHSRFLRVYLPWQVGLFLRRVPHPSFLRVRLLYYSGSRIQLVNPNQSLLTKTRTNERFLVILLLIVLCRSRTALAFSP